MKYIIVLLILLFIPIVSGVTIQRDESYVIRTVNNCVGFIEVVDTDKKLAVYNYNIKDCKREDNIWTCRCINKPFDIVLLQNVTENRDFNFNVRYFLRQEPGSDLPNEYNLREFPHEGIFVEVTPRAKKLPPLTERDKSFIITTVFGIIVFIGGIIFFIITVINKYKNNEDASDLDNEEQDEYLRNNT